MQTVHLYALTKRQQNSTILRKWMLNVRRRHRNSNAWLGKTYLWL